MRSFSSLLLPLAAASVASAQSSFVATSASAAATDMPSVTLDYCTVVATAGSESKGFYKYQNIRFAAAPTGDLRFAAPQDPIVETGVNTGDYADADVTCASEEDCLFMDVWAPADSAGKSLPVLVWTYGGGFTGGSKSENSPEGLFNLSTEFVYVAYNYRLGFTGLTNGPNFLHEGGTSNTAVWDVQQAFSWVNKYISNFGGNPDAVTAFGFSAGASQVLFQTTRFAGHAEQNFAQAYITSPGFVPGAGHEHAEWFYQNVSATVGCEGGSLECLRSVNFTELQTAAEDITSEYLYQLQPRVDGDIIADTYEAQLFQGRFNFSGPAVITHELHEVNGQAYSGVNTTEDVSKYLKIFFPSIEDEIIAQILELYPEDDYESPGLRFSDIKQSFDLTAHNLAFTNAMDNQTWNAECQLDEATHGTDQNYYWYKAETIDGEAVESTVDVTIALKMQRYLVSFVLTGDPNGMWSDEQVYWPRYNETETGIELVFNTTFTTGQDDLATAKSLFWNHAFWY